MKHLKDSEFPAVYNDPLWAGIPPLITTDTEPVWQEFA